MMSSILAIDRSENRKGPKRARAGRFYPAGGVDKFSGLPQHLVHQIMTRLPNKDNIHVSLLSKHFLSTWRSFPVIEFDFNAFSKKPRRRRRRVVAVDDAPVVEEDPLQRFSEHVVNSLRRRELTTDLERFVFVCRGLDGRFNYTRELVRTMSTFALDNNVRELVLNCFDSQLPGLPSELFSAASVKILQLSGFRLSPDNDGLLVLDSPKIENFALRNFTLDENNNDNDKAIKLSSPNLKSAYVDQTIGPPAAIQIGSSSKTMVSLFLRGSCEIADLSDCKTLENLELHHFAVSNELFADHVCALPALRRLTMRYCRGPERFSIPKNRSLEVLDMEECDGLEEVDVVAPNLKVLRFWSLSDGVDCDMNFDACTELREVVLRGAGFTVTSFWVADTVSRFGKLEKLVLSHCNLIEEVILTAPRLKVLELINCVDLRSFDIEADNLERFVLDGRLDFEPPTTLRARRAEADVRFRHFNKNSFKSLVGFLPSLARCRSVTLSCYRDERFVLPMEQRLRVVSPLFRLLRLKVNVSVKLLPTMILIENMLWLSPHPMTLGITINKKPHVTVTFNYKVPRVVQACEANESHYCHTSSIKCWRHFVSKVEVETFPSFTEPWESLERFFLEYAKSPVVIVRKFMR